MACFALIKRTFLYLLAAAALLGVPYAPADAQSSAPRSVETYIDQAVPTPLPEGLEPGKPLKAGDLYLKKKTPTPPAATPSRPKYPVGELQPPKLKPAAQPAKPPSLTASQNSSTKLMMMQGMKNALQQVGQNPNVPPSDLEAVDHTVPKAPQPTAETAPAEIAPTPTETAGIQYEPGQEPRNLSDTLPLKERTAVLDKPVEAAAADTEAPKATDLAESPPALADASEDTAGEDSIFGAPVRDEPAKTETEATKPATELAEVAPMPHEEPKADSVATADHTNTEFKLTDPEPETPAEPVKTAVATCEPKVTSWTKSCQDVGYPDNFTGSISGETRIECPDNAVQDVWLNNSCAPGAGGSAPARVTKTETRSVAQPKVEDEMAVAPVPATETEPVLESGTKPEPFVTPAKSAKTAHITVSTRVDAQCGSADGVASDQAPVDHLCASGLAGDVHGDGPWSWACSGQNGGKPAACQALRRLTGACGPAATSGLDAKPKRDLCATGTASTVNGTGPWNWTCKGEHGGAAVECRASAREDGVCGATATRGHLTAPSDELCSAGEASSVAGQGPWSWTCSGRDSGSSVTCHAELQQDGQCGAAHGNGFDKAPTADLCATGNASKLSGKGPWQWSCDGIAGGQSASCIANKGKLEITEAPVAPPAVEPSESVSSLCGIASQKQTDDVPTTDLCASGFGSSAWFNSASKQWNWECQSEDGASKATCTANTSQTKPIAVVAAKAERKTEPATTKKVEEPKPDTTLQCGAANGVAALEKPAAELCSNGKASAVSRKHTDWVWSCAQGKKTKITCTAPVILDGVCGSASGTAVSSKPLASLCQTGSATEVAGDGPWQWSCLGENGGQNVSCSASRPAPAAVAGVCGPAAQEMSGTKPQDGLCQSGSASPVYGEGPFSWTCSGFNGGAAASCVTQAPPPAVQAPQPGPSLDGLCGNANGVPAERQPASGLCSSGTVTGVSGNGPWNWNCLGANGGMSVSCTAPLMPPPPVNGVCGSANGMPTLTAPRSGLCDGGIASSVNGNGPWTWSCSGVNGGTAVSCVSPLATAGGSGPLPSLVQPTPPPSRGMMDEAPAPAAAPVGLVTPKLSSGALPPFRPIAPGLRNSEQVPAAPDIAPGIEIPAAPPALPQDLSPIQPPPIRDTSLPPPGLRPPVIDSTGAVIPGQRLQLESSVSTISFEGGSDMLQSSAADALNQLSTILLAHGNARITLTAYADNSGMSAREARRLSLARALAIRDYLVTKGIASGRIDVRALGANVPSGDPDRVDVKVN